jgi:hypothetical protein
MIQSRHVARHLDVLDGCDDQVGDLFGPFECFPLAHMGEDERVGVADAIDALGGIPPFAVHVAQDVLGDLVV